LVWLFSLEIDPLLIPIFSLILFPFKVRNITTSDTVEWKTWIPVVIGIFGLLFLYFPKLISKSLGLNATELSSFSFGVGATALWYVGGSVVDMLGLEIAVCLFIMAVTGADQQWLRDIIKWCGVLIAILLALYLALRLGWV